MDKIIRNGSRGPDELRSWNITRSVLHHAEGSALIEAGKTKVICAASVEDKVPQFLKNTGKGWVTAEYSMLPRSTHIRSPRERGRVGGRTITLDCDVIQADGGTRVASITAAWVALHAAFEALVRTGEISAVPLLDSVAAVSVGVVENELLLDLDYDEDSIAEVDMNVVMTGRKKLVEVQATAEGAPFSLSRMNSLIRLAQAGIETIRQIQMRTLNSTIKSGKPQQTP